MTLSGIDRRLAPWGRRGLAGLVFLALEAALLVSMALGTLQAANKT